MTGRTPCQRGASDAAVLSGSVDFGVLGPLQVRVGERVVEIRRGIPRVVLSALILQRGEVVSFDALIDRVWGQYLPAKPANALQTQVAYLRRVLGGGGSAPILTRATGYVLDAPEDAVDACRFERLVSRAARLQQVGTAASATDALATYDAALGLWRGLAYEDVADRPFAEAEAARLEELRLRAAEERIDLLLILGRPSDAVADLSALAAVHPLRERFHEQLVLALYRSGRQAEALRAYEAARRMLGEELGLDPGPRLRQLERQVLDQSPELDWAPLPGHSFPAACPDPDDGVASLSGLPRPPSTVVGRDDEVLRTHQLLERTRLLTLTGPGGAGKTTLTLVVAAKLAETRPLVFVDLAGVERDAAVGTAVASAVGAEVPPDGDVVSAIAARLVGTDAVLVLDTCEHVAAGAGAVAERVVERCPGVSVLATSRQALRARGELAWPVPPLRVPHPGEDAAESPAVRLFIERASAVAPALEATPAVLEDIASVCRSLDGLPLAIELAAAHADVFPPAAMRAQLADRLHLLGSSGPDRSERHRTLRSTIQWSVQLLGEHQRELLSRLAVLVGSFDVDAVAAIAAEGLDVTSDLVGLVRSSLVSPDSSGRYRLLDTVRAYVLDETDAATLRDARRRHAVHFTAVAEAAFAKVRGPGQRHWISRLRADVGNLRAALDWCFGPEGDPPLGARLAGAIAWVWTLDGRLVDARHALNRAEAVDDLEPLVRARVLLGVGLLAAPLGDLAWAREVCMESASLARSAGDPDAAADALITLGVAQWGLGEVEAAAATHDEAIELFRASGNVWGRTICRVLRARTAMDLGDLAEADELLDVAVEDARATGDAHVIGLAFEHHARLALASGDLERAEIAARQALSQNESIGYAEGVVAGLHILGRVHTERGEVERSRAHHLQALEVATRIGHAGGQCEALEAIAALDAATGDVDRAALLLLQAGRTRDRRSLPLRRADVDRLGVLRDEVRASVEGRWEGMERLVPLTSFDDTVARLLTST